jgi:cyclic pyranopterin phosphate synthase
MDVVTAAVPGSMVDSFGRKIDYVRISVTDRCNLRCRYCMAEHMQFLPKRDILTLEEIALLGDLFIARGVRRVRLDEVTLTTNGVLLGQFAALLADSGVRRINVSLDSRRPDRFEHITRGGDLGSVLRGISAAREAGLKVKVNMVALAGLNDDEFEDMLLWCDGEGLDLTLIETMPLGEVEEDRTSHYLPLDSVRRQLEQRFTLSPSFGRTGGPARYYDVSGLSSRLGMITPLSANFCAGCNRIRVAATGTVFGCLGHDQKVELRDALRSGGAEQVDALLDMLLAGKPKGHEFRIAAARPAVARHMSVTGG